MAEPAELARLRDLVVGLADGWAASGKPDDLDAVMGPVLQQIDGWDEMCAATWSLALIAGDALRSHHDVGHGQQLPLMFVDGTNGAQTDAAEVPASIRAAGRYFNAAVNRDIDTAAAIWESVPKPPGEVSAEGAAFLHAVWFASLEAYRNCRHLGRSQ